MAESFEEFMAAERELGRQAWARAEAAAMTDEDLAGLDPFQLRNDIADCDANQQPTTAALLRAMLDRAITWQATRVRPPRSRGEGER
jgi:hypothetical protein